MKQIEIKEKRKKREKHFLQENGEVIAHVFDEDIHYLKNGKYEEIDNTLIKDKNCYCNRSNAFRTFFDESGKDLMILKSNRNQIKMNLKDCNKIIPEKKEYGSKLYSSIFYKNIIDNIDLRYTLTPTKVKEEIILNDKSCSEKEIVFVIQSDLELMMNSDKTISVYDKNKNIFTLEAPFMIDSNNEINDNIYYELKKVDNNYELKLVLDKEWLNRESTKYPVVIDPTITNNGQNNSVYDTYIYSGDTNVTRYNKDILKVGVERINGVDRVNRALLKFDLPTIGTGSQIIDARINLVGYILDNYNDKNEFINVHQLMEDWTESGANWNNMSDKYNPKVEGGFPSFRSINSDNSLNYSTNYCIITNLVRKWYTDTPNYGIMLKLNDEVYTNSVIPSFYSKNNSISGDDPKPILAITYRNQNGIEGYMKYYKQQFSRGVVCENLYNGNLVTMFNIGQTTGGKLPANLDIVYNTNDVVLNNDIGYGLGYKLSLHQTIKETTIEEIDYLEFVDEDGTIHYFKKENELYYDEDGLNLTVEKTNNKYIMMDKNGNKKIFEKIENIGYLTKCLDVSNNITIIEYNEEEKISKIIDANNAELNLIYETDKISIVSPDGTIYLNYSNNQLINITSQTGITSFSYNENDLISEIEDEKYIKYTYEYYEKKPYKIKSVKQHGTNNNVGKTLDFIYGFNMTKIINEKNKTEIFTFNSIGNTISIIDSIYNNSIIGAYGKRGAYGEFLEQKNKPLSNISSEQYVKNYLVNTSFEKEQIEFFTTETDMSITNEFSRTGSNSLKLINSNINEEVFQSVTVPKGKYYTFSGYFKNSNEIKIYLSYINGSNTTIKSESVAIPPREIFDRQDVTIFYPETAISELKINIVLVSSGIVYLDDIQLEEGEVANNYNCIENSDFSEGLFDWETSITEQGNLVEIDGVFEVVNIEEEKKALKINFNPKYATTCEKTLEISGKAGDIYNLSFWYKNNGIKEVYPFTDNMVYLYFNYDDERLNQHCILSDSLNSNCSDWQFQNSFFLAAGDFKSLTLRFVQYGNANDMYLTNIGLYKNTQFFTYRYDENGNVISIQEVNDRSDTFAYDKNNHLITSINPKGKKFTYEYDKIISDRLLRGTSEMGICNEIIYDNNNNPITNKILNYNSNQSLCNGLYKIRLKGTNKYLKNINNIINVKEEKCNHNKWLIEQIDDYFRIKHSIITDKVISIQNNKVILSSELNDNSLFSFIKRDNGSYLIKLKDVDKYLFYDSFISINELEEDNSNFEFFFEDDSYKFFVEKNVEYSEDGKFIVKVINENLNEIAYDIDYTTGLKNSERNAKNIITQYQYNDKRQLIKVNCSDREISYNYNDKNLIDSISCGNKEYKIVYDEFLNIKNIKIGDNITLISHNYANNNGNLLSSTYGNANTINYNYDDFNRITKLIKMDNTYEYKYGNKGELTKILSDEGRNVIKYTYDTLKRLTEYKNNDFSIKYQYDENDNVVNESYILNEVEHSINSSYNDDDSIINITFDNNNINYVFDQLGRLKNKKINNTYNIDYGYISNGRRNSLLINSIDNNGSKYYYKYDKLDNITHIYHNDNLINKYYYNNFNELIKEIDYEKELITKYKYDNYGNILNVQFVKLSDNSFVFENKYEYSNQNWQDQLTKFNSDVILYDQIGNPTQIGNAILTWINGRELNSYTNDQVNVKYKYNEDGIRTSKTVNNVETRYYLEGDNIIFEQIDDNLIYYIRNEEGELEGIMHNEMMYFYVKNIQNDIIGILDNNYKKIATYEYDSWGNILNIIDEEGNTINDLSHIAHINPYRYRSYYYDSETCLYYLNSRYYNPIWGRFINADGYLGTGQGLLGYNMYSYANNNPINFYDESGKFLKKLWKKIKTKTKKIVTKVKTVAKNVIKSLKNNFTFEIGSGNGIAYTNSVIFQKNTKKSSQPKKSQSSKKKNILKKLSGITLNCDSTVIYQGYKNGAEYKRSETNNSIAIGPIGYGSSLTKDITDPVESALTDFEEIEGFSVTGGENFVVMADETEFFIGFEFGLIIGSGGIIRIGWEIDYK